VYFVTGRLTLARIDLACASTRRLTSCKGYDRGSHALAGNLQPRQCDGQAESARASAARIEEQYAAPPLCYDAMRMAKDDGAVSCEDWINREMRDVCTTKRR
jgi:hypothetical protein